MNNIEVTSRDYLKCDNPKCNNEVEVPFADYKNWINAPCPKCGENLLTQDDYERALVVRSTIDYLNSLSVDDFNELNEVVAKLNPERINQLKEQGLEDNQLIKMSIDTHNEIKMTIQKD